MKKPAYTLVLCLLLVLLTMLRSYAAAADALPHISPASTDTLDVPCAAAVLIDEDSGTVLYEKNADQQRPIASITKLMTLLLTFEALSAGRIALTDTVPVSEHAYHMGGSQIWLEPGEQMTLDDMLKAICISSANDAAVAVAEFVGGSEPAFVQQMNARAAELGLTNTHFENSCGLDAEGHLSTARDVAMMSREILLRHAEVRNYCSIWMDTLRGGATQLVNTNKMLKTYNGITGLKTGTTSKAGVCISASAERNGLRLIAVVLGASSGKERFEAATALLDYGFANYENVTPQLPENAPETIAVSHGTAHGSHCLGILRIGYVIGETSVGIEELAALGVGSQLAQYPLKETSTAVACIHNDVHSLERMLIVVGMHALTDVVSNVARVYCHEVEYG